METELVGIASLKRETGESPQRFRVRVQVGTVVQKLTRSQKGYHEATLSDAEGDFVLRVWGDSPAAEEAAHWKTGDFLEVDGEWTNGKFGLEPRNWEARSLSADEIGGLLEGSPELRARQDADYSFITESVGAIADPRLRALCTSFLETFGNRFRRSAGARNYHHARRGGLVEHTAQMMRAALAVVSVYPSLNRDLLVAGVLFHDCGKLWENCYAESGFTMPYNLAGELLGHIPMGIELANKLWREVLDGSGAAGWKTLEPASEDVRLHLLHLIGSHHGEYAFGSPVLPKTPEACALHYIDNLDAKMEMFDKGYDAANVLAKGIYERVRPLPANLVQPLPPVAGEGA